MLGAAFFVINIFKTITYTPEGWDKQPAGALLASALGLTGLGNLFRKKKKEHLVPLPVAAVARGTVDMALNSATILFTGVLILVYMVAALFGTSLKHTAIDALLYKNWFWWGLDLVADGLVLIFVAGTWYLLATMITGKKLFMENIARAALLVELVVSWTVWSHHLLSDQAQPAILKVVSGEMVTAFELITQGLAFFITLATLWSARPLKMTNELKFLLGGLLGFALGVPAGIIQADVGLNRILHNTQWIVGPHVHVAVLVGLTMTLYSAIYILFPILTNGAKLYSQKLANIHFWAHLSGGIGMGAFMGMAGLQGHAAPDDLLQRRVQRLHDPGRPVRRIAPARVPVLLLQHRHERRAERRAGHLQKVDARHGSSPFRGKVRPEATQAIGRRFDKGGQG